MADLSDQIETNSAEPESVTVDGITVKQRTLEEQIKADRYLKSVDAANSEKRGLNIAKLSPPGTA